MTKFSENFVGCYPLSKTLKFELRPVKETKEYLKIKDCPLLENDLERNKQYTVIKELLDKYYRYFIEECLRGQKLDEALISKAYEAYKIKDTKTQKEAERKLRKQVSDLFSSKVKKQFCLDEYKNLLILEKKDMKPSVLMTWMTETAKFSEAEIKRYIEAIKSFDKFTTYFGGYSETRENMFSEEDKASAISHRIVNQNMLRFFSNVITFEKIKNKYPELYKQIEKFADSFKVESFAGILSQSEIDKYNYEVIGRPEDDCDYQGVNSLINEYRQKNGIKNRELPVMSILYKQILSDRDNSIMADMLKSDDEAKSYIQEKYADSFGKACALSSFFNNFIETEGYSSIYLKQQNLKDISHSIFGEWNVLVYAVENYGIKNNILNLKQVEEAFLAYCENLDKDIAEKYKAAFDLKSYLSNSPELDDILPDTAEKISAYKPAMDTMLDFIRFYKPFYLYDGNKSLPVPADGIGFCAEFNALYEPVKEFSRCYDKIRNFATQKPYSQKKIKLNFNLPTLLNGWDINKEEDNASFLFIKDGQFYLGIADKESRKIFDLNNSDMKSALNFEGEFYEKIQYKQVSGFNKMLPKVVFSDKQKVIFGPLITDRILEIREKKLYTSTANNRKAVIEWIDFMKAAIARHPEWNDYFNFHFRDSEQYMNVNEFYEDLDSQAYRLNKIKVSASYVETLVKKHKLYLFQIYCKDFSTEKKKKGTDNLHTMYWKCLFGNENLEALDDGKSPIFKLNGKAEVFMREASLPYKITHPKNQPVDNKNPLNEKRRSSFSYNLIKNKRFTERKYFFHCPITINFRADSGGGYYYNDKVNRFIEKNPDVNIIGIDRGERHLLYYTVINQNGKILEQGSLNTISNSYTGDSGNTVIKVTDYHGLLDRKEIEKKQAQLNWGTIENIKELKAGYLSQVVHKLATLVDKYNAIVVLENLNMNFKRSRTKVEKQVYQKFEKALIDKLSYLVFKDRGYGEAGSYANGLQLSAPFESFEKLRKQTGVVYYVVPSYTSHIDPKTGFVNLLGRKLTYESAAKACDVMGGFDSIMYNVEKDWFEFSFDYKSFDIDMPVSRWTVCTHGDNYWGFNSKEKKAVAYDVNAELKNLFDKYQLQYQDGKELRNDILQQKKPDFWKTLLYMLRLAMQMRNTVAGTSNENDYILSPVQYEKGKFFDSRKACDDEPQNADANGAYHIALKGLQAMGRIENGKLQSFKEGEERKAWFAFMQKQEFLDK